MPIIQKIQKTVETLQALFVNEVVDIAVVMHGKCLRFRSAQDRDNPVGAVHQQDRRCTVVMQRQVPTIQTAQKTEVPQSQYLDRVVDVLVVMQPQSSMPSAVQ